MILRDIRRSSSFGEETGMEEKVVCIIDDNKNKWKVSFLFEGGIMSSVLYITSVKTPYDQCSSKANGCDNRLKYPGSFLLTDATFWKALTDNGYEINAFVKESMNRIGLLPHPFEEYVKYRSFSDSLNNLKLTDNSFTFSTRGFMDENDPYRLSESYSIKKHLPGGILTAELWKQAYKRAVGKIRKVIIEI